MKRLKIVGARDYIIMLTKINYLPVTSAFGGGISEILLYAGLRDIVRATMSMIIRSMYKYCQSLRLVLRQ